MGKEIRCPECKRNLTLDKDNNQSDEFINCGYCGNNFINPYYDDRQTRYKDS